MLGINKLSPGRMGNRLFHYNFLRQIAKKLGTHYYHIKFPESKYFLGMGVKPKIIPCLQKPIKVNSKDILAKEPGEFLNFINEKIEQGRDVVFEPPILGEVFFDYLFYNPNDFIKIKHNYQIDHSYENNQIFIGVHFRGADFSIWNPDAALKFDYYEEALNFCITAFEKKRIVFSLFTDDLEYPAYLRTLLYLNDYEVILGDPRRLPIYDFYFMSQCDVLISSPSTFAIFAGILGKQKRIIHSKCWLDYATDRNDMFWVRLKETNNPYYNLWKAF